MVEVRKPDFSAPAQEPVHTDHRFARFWARLKLRSHYRGVFGPTQSTQIVLADLARFCYATKSTFMINRAGHADPVAMAMAEGRREVFNRIRAMLNLSDQRLYEYIENGE